MAIEKLTRSLNVAFIDDPYLAVFFKKLYEMKK